MQENEGGAEPVGIDPRVDCVFKAVLGDPAHSEVLVDFLNAVLNPSVPIVTVQILNPIQLPHFVGDDFSILDVLAQDEDGRIFQVEMQNFNKTAMKPRMVYNWATVYTRQKDEGKGFKSLRPVISI